MMAQPTFPPGMGPGHPGMGGPGHPMAAMQHPGGHMGGHPPGMMQGMHPGVSGPQVQGPMVTGMPQGPGTPAPGHMPGNSMAMAHLGGPQQHMFHQQNPQMNFGQMGGPTAQQVQQQAMLRQRMMQQMGGQPGMMHGMPNNPMVNQAQLAQMKMNMPIQQQMQQMQQNPQMQQFRNQQHQQQLIAAHNHAQQQQQQQALAQQQRQAAQQMQLSRSQGEQQQQAQQQAAQQQAAQQAAQQTSQPPQPHSTPAPQVQPQSQPTPQPQPTPSQTPVPQNKPAPPQQPPTASNQHTPQQQPPQNQTTPQIKQGENEDDVQIKQQDSDAAMMMPEMPKEQMFNGHAILQLIMFQDSLSSPERPTDISYWNDVINKHFSPIGQLKMQLFNTSTGTDKSYLLQAASLARFYHTHFTSGVKQLQLSSFKHTQTKQPNGQTSVMCSTASLTYVFAHDIRITTAGSMLVLFDELNRIVRLDLITGGWNEFVPRNLATAALATQRSSQQNVKQSPKVSNKNLKKVQQQEPDVIEAPSAGVTDWGIPGMLLNFLEIVEVCLNMVPLMDSYWQNAGHTPLETLSRMNHESQQHMRMQNQVARQANGQVQFPPGGINGPNQFASPAMQHLGLPQSQGSPHLGGPVHTPSPAQNAQGGVAMMHQMSAQGSNLSGSQGPSTNTSPNVSNKRRRPSTVKAEDDNVNANQDGNQNKVKPSPRIGGKRQKAA